MSGRGEGPLVNSVKVVMVVSVSLHHQQCDNFCKIQQKNAKWSGAIIYMWHFIVLLPSGVSCKGMYYSSLRASGPEGHVYFKVDCVWTC